MRPGPARTDNNPAVGIINTKSLTVATGVARAVGSAPV
jgi:hypothetical protein